MTRFSALFLILITILLLQVNTACQEKEEVVRPASLHNTEYVSGEIIIKFTPEAFNEKGEIVSGSISALNFKYGLVAMDRVFKNGSSSRELAYVYNLKFQTGLDINEAIEEYKKDPYVIYAEPNYIAHTMKKGRDADKKDNTFR